MLRRFLPLNYLVINLDNNFSVDFSSPSTPYYRFCVSTRNSTSHPCRKEALERDASTLLTLTLSHRQLLFSAYSLLPTLCIPIRILASDPYRKASTRTLFPDVIDLVVDSDASNMLASRLRPD